MIIWGNGIREPFHKWKLEVLFQLFLRNKGSDLYHFQTENLSLSDRESLTFRPRISPLAFPEPSAPA